MAFGRLEDNPYSSCPFNERSVDVDFPFFFWISSDGSFPAAVNLAMKPARAWALMVILDGIQYRTRSILWPIESIVQQHRVYSSPYGVGGL